MFLSAWIVIAAIIALFWKQARLEKRIAQLEAALLARQAADLSPAATAGRSDAAVLADPQDSEQPPATLPASAPAFPSEVTPNGAVWERQEGAADPKVDPKADPSLSALPQVSRRVLPPLGAKTSDPLSPAPRTASRTYVFNAAVAKRLMAWLSQNWTLAIAALSLMLGGLFMVQYGIENGLLSPRLRVLGALALGAALIAGGEVMRRRFGDFDAATASLPSTLSGAGVVVAFIAVLSAQSLYGLIGPLTALIGLAGLSFAALLMGLLYGSALSFIGIVGAVAAPFLIGGESENTRLLYPYFALIGLTGLAIDSFKRRAWISVLAIAAPSVGVTLLWIGAPDALGLAVAAVAVALGAVMLPSRSLLPDLGGALVTQQILRRGEAEFPTRLGFIGMGLASAAGVVLVVEAHSAGMAQAWLGYGLLALLAGFAGIWLAPARAFADLALLPTLAFLVALAAAPFSNILLSSGLAAGETVIALVCLAGLFSALSFWRMLGAPSPTLARGFAFGAALVLPAAMLIFDLFWSDRFTPRYLQPETPPAPDFWGFGWAVTVLCGAALMVAFAQLRMRGTGGDLPDDTKQARRFDAGLFAGSACVLITLALFVLLTKAALTLALSVLVLAAALLYRRLAMAPLGWVFQLGAALIGYRLIVDPGLIWLLDDGALASAILSCLGPLLAFVAVVRVIPRAANPLMRATAESGALNTGALMAMVVLARWAGESIFSHWGFGLMAAIWVGSCLGQVYRRRESKGAARHLRTVFAWLAGASALLNIGLMIFGLALLLEPMAYFGGGLVSGPPLFDSLALALLPLALSFGLGARALYPTAPTGFTRHIRKGMLALAGLFAALWGWFEIRRLWRGPDLSVGTVSDGELYSYTVAMLAVSLGLLGLAVLRRSGGLRKLAMAGVALTIAKVFLIDMSGLSGLTRVVSFIGLGLALTALAWLNRKIAEIWDRGPSAPEA